MNALLESLEFVRPLTMTTRQPRAEERDGVHYIFSTPEAFLTAQKSGELVEYANVHGELYGTPRQQLRLALASGQDVLLQLDIQGALAIRHAIPEALLLFIAPESIEQIAQRLEERGADEVERTRRLKTARSELNQIEAFDHAIVNIEGNLDGTVAQVRLWVDSQRNRTDRTRIEV